MRLVCQSLFNLPVKARIHRIEVLRVHRVPSETQSVGNIALSNRWELNF